MKVKREPILDGEKRWFELLEGGFVMASDGVMRFVEKILVDESVASATRKSRDPDRDSVQGDQRGMPMPIEDSPESPRRDDPFGLSPPSNASDTDAAQPGCGFLCFRQRPNDPPNFMSEILILGLIVPYAGFLGSVLIWTHVYPVCPAWVYAWMMSTLGVAVWLFLHGFQHFPRPQKPLTLQDQLPGFTHPLRNHVWGTFLLFMAFAGCAFGRYNYYANKFPVVSLDDRQVYKDVTASDDPMLYRDAGLLHFSKTSKIEPTMFRGFRYQNKEYCTAPILDGGIYVGYFATGTDCCDESFHCGTGSQGIVMPKYESRIFSPPNSHNFFAIAAGAAAETFHLELREEPIFVKLTSDVAQERDAWLSLIFGFTLLPAFIGPLLCLIVCTVSIIFFRRKMHKKVTSG